MSSQSPMFHDAHAHDIGSQSGGFIIALEGEANLPYMKTNAEVWALQDVSRMLIAVPYARNLNEGSNIESPVMKYHPRREGFSPQWVAKDIARFDRKIALIDTLNSVAWEPRAYLHLAQAFPDVQFLFCHAGGYDILEFIKFARFVPNVWLDFSATQEIFGWVGSCSNLPVITDAIDHAYQEARISSKVLFGSDFPGFKQEAAVNDLVTRIPSPKKYLVDNFERLLDSSL